MAKIYFISGDFILIKENLEELDGKLNRNKENFMTVTKSHINISGGENVLEKIKVNKDNITYIE